MSDIDGKRAIRFRREIAISILYDDLRLDCGFRMDFLVGNQVVLELKAVKALDPIFTAQVLSYRGGCHPPAGQRLPRTPSACSACSAVKGV